MNILAKIRNSWKSLTMWFNGISGAALLALPDMQNSFPQLQPYINAKLFRYAMIVIVVGNLLLRMKTTKPLEHK